MGPESRLVARMLKALRAKGGFWFKVHGGPYQVAGIPDIIGCYHGRFVAIEAKIPGNLPTQLQWLTLEQLTAAGARAGVAYSVAQALTIAETPVVLLTNDLGKW